MKLDKDFRVTPPHLPDVKASSYFFSHKEALGPQGLLVGMRVWLLGSHTLTPCREASVGHQEPPENHIRALTVVTVC